VAVRVPIQETLVGKRLEVDRTLERWKRREVGREEEREGGVREKSAT